MKIYVEVCGELKLYFLHPSENEKKGVTPPPRVEQLGRSKNDRIIMAIHKNKP